MVLYHASQIKSLGLIKPQKTLSRNKYIGDYVFATKNKNLAVMYLVPKGIVTLMDPDGDNANIVICAGKDDFIRKDRGGAVYVLPGDSFVRSPQKEISKYEMVSTRPVKPKGKTVYGSAINALMSAGVKIRFTDNKTFEKLIRSPGQKKIIESLEAYKP